MRIVFFGTPAFAADVLNFLLENGQEVVGVISRPDKPKGRSNVPVPGAVRLVAEAHGIPHFQPEKVSASDFLPILEQFHADLFIVVAYGEILRQHVLDLPKKACLNVHASLLPSYRGAAPIQHAVINGETESGISIMYMVRKMDAGDVILESKIKIGPDMSYGELEMQMRQVGAMGLLQVIQEFAFKEPARTVQDESKVTFAPKIELEDCAIDWTLSSEAIHNLIRGVNPEPGAWCLIEIHGQKKRLKVYSSKKNNHTGLLPGECFIPKTGELIVGCGEGAIELLEVQLEGKKRMKASDFCRGYLNTSWTFI